MDMKEIREIQFSSRELCSGVQALGNAYAFVYLIGNSQRALIDAGTAFWGLQIKGYFEREGLGGLDYLMLTHSHYDHVGGVPVLMESISIGEIIAHKNFERVFSSKRALGLIQELNRKELELLGVEFEYTFKPFSIDRYALDGETISMDDIQIRILDTPGHTRDSVTYYVLPCKLAVVGEAVGVPNADYSYILPQFLADVDLYLRSFEKIASLDIEILGLPHERIITGRDEVIEFLERSRRYTMEYIEEIERALDMFGEDMEKVMEYMIEKFYKNRRIRQPLYAFVENLRAQVRAVKKRKFNAM